MNLRKHHIVGVASLLADRLRPPLSISGDLVNGLSLIRSIPIRATEVIPMPLHLAIFVASAWEVKSQPSLNLIRLANLFRSVILVHLYSKALLGLVRASFVIHHCIPIQANSQLFRLRAQLKQVVFCSPFCAHIALLIKFPDVVQIVDIIAIALCSALGFAARGQPDVVDANRLERGDGGEQSFVMRLVGWDVPFEALEKDRIWWGGFPI